MKDLQAYKKLKVAVVHDWLTGMRGGEKVLQEILSIFPNSEIFTLLHNRGSCSDIIEDRKIHESFIAKFPFASRKYRNYLPYFPAAVENFNLDGFDLVISSSHCVAKGVIVPVGTPHLCYIHTPMRYAYDMYHHYFSPETTGRLKRFFIANQMTRLRTWDQATHSRVDKFAANSKFVAARVKRLYMRDADVVHPPVDTEFYTPGDGAKDDYFLMVSALEPYKRVDVAIQSFTENGLPLKIAGGGSQYKRLKKTASGNIQLLGKVSDGEIRELYRKARAFIFPGIEDFGITPLESQACGTPVIAFGAGGALETVIENKTGLFFNEQTPEALSQAIDKHEQMDFNTTLLRKNSEKFSKENFRKKFIKFVKKQSGI